MSRMVGLIVVTFVIILMPLSVCAEEIENYYEEVNDSVYELPSDDDQFYEIIETTEAVREEPNYWINQEIPSDEEDKATPIIEGDPFEGN